MAGRMYGDGRVKVQEEIRMYNAKIQDIKEQSRKMKALMLLSLWIRKYVLPKVRTQIRAATLTSSRTT